MGKGPADPLPEVIDEPPRARPRTAQSQSGNGASTSKLEEPSLSPAAKSSRDERPKAIPQAQKQLPPSTSMQPGPGSGRLPERLFEIPKSELPIISDQTARMDVLRESLHAVCFWWPEMMRYIAMVTDPEHRSTAQTQKLIDRETLSLIVQEESVLHETQYLVLNSRIGRDCLSRVLEAVPPNLQPPRVRVTIFLRNSPTPPPHASKLSSSTLRYLKAVLQMPRVHTVSVRILPYYWWNGTHGEFSSGRPVYGLFDTAEKSNAPLRESSDPTLYFVRQTYYPPWPPRRTSMVEGKKWFEKTLFSPFADKGPRIFLNGAGMKPWVTRTPLPQPAVDLMRNVSKLRDPQNDLVNSGQSSGVTLLKAVEPIVPLTYDEKAPTNKMSSLRLRQSATAKEEHLGQMPPLSPRDEPESDSDDSDDYDDSDDSDSSKDYPADEKPQRLGRRMPGPWPPMPRDPRRVRMLRRADEWRPVDITSREHEATAPEAPLRHAEPLEPVVFRLPSNAPAPLPFATPKIPPNERIAAISLEPPARRNETLPELLVLFGSLWTRPRLHRLEVFTEMHIPGLADVVSASLLYNATLVLRFDAPQTTYDEYLALLQSVRHAPELLSLELSVAEQPPPPHHVFNGTSSSVLLALADALTNTHKTFMRLCLFLRGYAEAGDVFALLGNLKLHELQLYGVPETVPTARSFFAWLGMRHALLSELTNNAPVFPLLGLVLYTVETSRGTEYGARRLVYRAVEQFASAINMLELETPTVSATAPRPVNPRLALDAMRCLVYCVQGHRTMEYFRAPTQIQTLLLKPESPPGPYIRELRKLSARLLALLRQPPVRIVDVQHLLASEGVAKQLQRLMARQPVLTELAVSFTLPPAPGVYGPDALAATELEWTGVGPMDAAGLRTAEELRLFSTLRHFLRNLLGWMPPNGEEPGVIAPYALSVKVDTPLVGQFRRDNFSWGGGVTRKATQRATSLWTRLELLLIRILRQIPVSSPIKRVQGYLVTSLRRAGFSAEDFLYLDH